MSNNYKALNGNFFLNCYQNAQKIAYLHASAMAFDLGSKIIFALCVLEGTGVISERKTGSSQDSSEINLCHSQSVSKK